MSLFLSGVGVGVCICGVVQAGVLIWVGQQNRRHAWHIKGRVKQ